MYIVRPPLLLIQVDEGIVSNVYLCSPRLIQESLHLLFCAPFPSPQRLSGGTGTVHTPVHMTSESLTLSLALDDLAAHGLATPARNG